MRVRWKIFLFLFGFGFIAYLQQRSITVASYQMMPQLGLSQMQIGWLETALIVGYTIMQFPGGVLGQRHVSGRQNQSGGEQNVLHLRRNPVKARLAGAIDKWSHCRTHVPKPTACCRSGSDGGYP